MLTGILLVLTILIYAGMAFGYRPYLENTLSDISGQLAKVTSSLNAGTEDVFVVYSQLYNIQSLSAKHAYGSKIFSILEKGTLPAVRLTKAAVKISEGDILLEGTASDYDTVVQQLAAYKNTPGIAQAQLISAQTKDGAVNFSADLTAQKDYFSTQN